MDHEHETLLRGSKTRYDSVQHDHVHSERRSPLLKACAILLILLFLVLFAFTLIISILSPVVWTKMTTMIAQNALNSAVMTIESGVLYNPTPTSVSLTSVVTITQAGAVAGNMSDVNVTVYYLNKPFGIMRVPPAYFEAGKATTFTQTAELDITDNAVFQQQASAVMNGQSVAWRLSGPVSITFKQLGISLTVDLHMEKEIVLNGGAPQNVTAYDLDVVTGPDANTLVSTVTQYLYNPSTIAVTGLGHVVLDSYTEDGIKLGEAIVPDFSILVGDNYQTGVQVKTIRTPENSAAISQFVSNWAMGIDQKTYLVGPTSVSSGANYFLNVTRLSAVIKGYNGPPLVYQAQLNDNFQPTQMIHNPTGVNVSQSNFNMKLTIPPLVNSNGRTMYVAYTALNPVKTTCAADDFGGFITIPTVNISAKSNTSKPIVVAPDSSRENSCGYLAYAVCCSLYDGTLGTQPVKGEYAYFDAVAEGTFDLTAENFTVTQYTKQPVSMQCFSPSLWTAFCQFDVDNPPFLYRDWCSKPSKGQVCPGYYYDPTVQHLEPVQGNHTVNFTTVNGTWMTKIYNYTQN